MTRIQYSQNTFVESSHQICIGSRNLHAIRGVHHRISTAVQFFRRQRRTNGIHHPTIRLRGVDITRFFVICKIQQVCLPITKCRGKVVIMADFAQYRLSLSDRRYGDSAYPNIHPTFTIAAFIVVHQSKIIVGAEAQLVVGVIKSFVTRHIILSVAHDIAVVGRGTSKKRQIFEFSVTATIHHAHKITNGGRIWRARRKLVVDFVHVDDNAGQTIQFSMIISQFLCLFHENGRGQNQVVGLSNGMNVLIRYFHPAFNIHSNRRGE